jgi:hypothetical protein
LISPKGNGDYGEQNREIKVVMPVTTGIQIFL